MLPTCRCPRHLTSDIDKLWKLINKDKPFKSRGTNWAIWLQEGLQKKKGVETEELVRISERRIALQRKPVSKFDNSAKSKKVGRRMGNYSF